MGISMGARRSLQLHIAKNRFCNITSLHSQYALTLLIYFLSTSRTNMHYNISFNKTSLFSSIHTCNILPHTSLKFHLTKFWHYHCLCFLFLAFPWNALPSQQWFTWHSPNTYTNASIRILLWSWCFVHINLYFLISCQSHMASMHCFTWQTPLLLRND